MWFCSNLKVVGNGPTKRIYLGQPKDQHWSNGFWSLSHNRYAGIMILISCQLEFSRSYIQLHNHLFEGGTRRQPSSSCKQKTRRTNVWENKTTSGYGFQCYVKKNGISGSLAVWWNWLVVLNVHYKCTNFMDHHVHLFLRVILCHLGLWEPRISNKGEKSAGTIEPGSK